MTAQELFDWLNTNYPTYASTVQNIGDDMVSLVSDLEESQNVLVKRYRLFRLDFEVLLRRMPNDWALFQKANGSGWGIKFKQDPVFDSLPDENLKRFVIRWIEDKKQDVNTE